MAFGAGGRRGVGGGWGLMCVQGNVTVNVHLSTLWWGKMQAIFLDRFPFKAAAPRGCKNRIGERRVMEGAGGRGDGGWRVGVGGVTPAPFQAVRQNVAGSA